jgi:hypothetical protein
MPTAVGPDDNADGEPEDEDGALAVPGFGSSASPRFRARVLGGGTRPTQWVARMAESVGSKGGRRYRAWIRWRQQRGPGLGSDGGSGRSTKRERAHG